ncbi:MAG: hypothetical protein ABI068_04075 [Ktedonobacterales bacterium]
MSGDGDAGRRRQQQRRPGQSRPSGAPTGLAPDTTVAPSGDYTGSIGQIISSESAAAEADSPSPSLLGALMELRDLGDAVAAVGRAFQIESHRLALAEALDSLQTTTSLPLDELLAGDLSDNPEQVAAWFRLLGDDLALDLSLEGLDPDAEPINATLRAGRDPRGALQAFLAAAQPVVEIQGADVSAVIRIAIGKTQAQAIAHRILAERPGELAAPDLLAHTNVVVMYQTAAWERLVALERLDVWASRGIVSAENRCCVFVCDAAGYLGGVALEIVGAANITAPVWLPVSPSAWRRFVERARQIRALRAEEQRWDHAPRFITPEHVALVERHAATTADAGLAETARRLAALRAALAATYLASQVDGTFAQGLNLRFAGARPTICRPDGDADIATDSADDSTLARLAGWAYAGGSPATLTIARECLADELPGGASVTLAQVEQAAETALEAAKANLTLYIQRNTTQYFALRQAAQDAVGAYSETVRKAVSDLTSDMVDSVYRTAALLVGIAIAWLIQPLASLWLLRIAIPLYVAYIVFLLLFVMRARWDRYVLEQTALRNRLATMDELTANLRARLIAPTIAADDYFQRYFRRSCWLYVALGALGIVLFILLWTPLAHSLAPAITSATPTPTHIVR